MTYVSSPLAEITAIIVEWNVIWLFMRLILVIFDKIYETQYFFSLVFFLFNSIYSLYFH